MADKFMMADFNKSVSDTAHDVMGINAWSIRATASVANALLENDPLMTPDKAMLGAIKFTQDMIEDELAGRNMFKRALPAAVLGKALREEYGPVLENRLVARAGNAAGHVYRKRMREQQDIRRKMTRDVNAAWASPVSAGPSLGIDLGAFAKQSAQVHAIADAAVLADQRKNSVPGGVSEGFVEDHPGIAGERAATKMIDDAVRKTAAGRTYPAKSKKWGK